MDREEMVKRSWRPYMTVDYKHPRMTESLPCMLVSISFDDEIVELQPFGEDIKRQSFYSTIQNIEMPKRMKLLTKDGKKIKDEIHSADKVELQNFRNTDPIIEHLSED